jgi:hypothetical protein
MEYEIVLYSKSLINYHWMEVRQLSKHLAEKDRITIKELGTILCFIVTWSRVKVAKQYLAAWNRVKNLVEWNRVKDAEHKPIILTGVPRPEPGLSNTDLWSPRQLTGGKQTAGRIVCVRVCVGSGRDSTATTL